MKRWLIIFLLAGSRFCLPESCPTFISSQSGNCGQGNTTITPCSVTLNPLTVGQNQLLVLIVGQQNADNQSPLTQFTVGSSAGLTYSNAVGGPSGNAHGNILYAETGSFSGTESVTINCLANTNCGGNKVPVSIANYSGVALTSPLDQTGDGGGTVNNTTVSSGAFTTVSANELMIAYCNGGFFTSISQATGWTQYTAGGNTDGAEYKNTTTAGSYVGQCIVNSIGVVNWYMSVASFKANPATCGAGVRHRSQVY